MNRRLLAAWTAAILLAALAPAVRAQDDKDDPDPNVGEYTIPEGTEFKLQLHTTINSKTSKAGDRVVTTLIDPVSVEDTDVLAKGLRIDGHIGEAKAAARRGKGGYISIIFDTVELSNGEKLAILGSLTEVFSSVGGGNPIVGPEGDLKGRGPSLKKRAAIAAVPIGAGAAGVAGGATALGAAAAAGGVAAAILLPRGQQAALSAGSLIGMRLDRDVTLSAAAAAPPAAEGNPPSSGDPAAAGKNTSGNAPPASNTPPADNAPPAANAARAGHK
jgi:hypothetical protein